MKRGMDMFRATVMEEIQASEAFLVLLLESIEEWARSVGPNVPAYQQLYQELIEQGVTFPVYSAEQVQLNRLRAMKPREVVAFVKSQLEAQREDPEKVKLHVEVLRDKRQELTNTVSMSTLNPRVMQAHMACLDEIDLLLTLAETYQKAESPPRAPAKQAAPVTASVDRTAELISKAMKSWAAVEEPGTVPAPVSLYSDNEDELDIDLRPDLEYIGAVSPSIRHSGSYYTLKGKKSQNDDFVEDI